MTLSHALVGAPAPSVGPRVPSRPPAVRFEVARPAGAHRDPAATPWRTGLRELLALLTAGRVLLYTHRCARCGG